MVLLEFILFTPRVIISRNSPSFLLASVLWEDVREGWAPLCAFLGCPVPDITFPRLNSSRQFTEEEWATP